MTNRFITTIILLIALIGAGFYFAPEAPSARATTNYFILTWSANSYVPLSYEGKALPIRGSKIKVFALPAKKLAQNPDYLYYRWLLDDDVVGWASGVGNSFFQFTASKWAGDYHKIESQILDSQQGATLSQNSIYIKIIDPEVLISSSSNSNYSIIEKVIAKTGQNLTILAEPLFFNVQKISDLIFNWTLDGQAPTSIDEKNQNQMTIKIPAGNLSASIFKNLSLSVQKQADQMQQSTVNLSVEIK